MKRFYLLSGNIIFLDIEDCLLSFNINSTVHEAVRFYLAMECCAYTHQNRKQNNNHIKFILFIADLMLQCQNFFNKVYFLGTYKFELGLILESSLGLFILHLYFLPCSYWSCLGLKQLHTFSEVSSYLHFFLQRGRCNFLTKYFSATDIESKSARRAYWFYINIAINTPLDLQIIFTSVLL